MYFHYRITGFFCGCKFLRFISKKGTCYFCDFIFCDFTPWQSDFNSLDDMKNISINPSRNTSVLFLWTQANWSRNDPSRLDLNCVTLDHVYLNTVSSVGAVWVVHAYINENSTHRSETKITDKCFKILFLIFLHCLPHE